MEPPVFLFSPVYLYPCPARPPPYRNETYQPRIFVSPKPPHPSGQRTILQPLHNPQAHHPSPLVASPSTRQIVSTANRSRLILGSFSRGTVGTKSNPSLVLKTHR